MALALLPRDGWDLRGNVTARGHLGKDWGAGRAPPSQQAGAFSEEGGPGRKQGREKSIAK